VTTEKINFTKLKDNLGKIIHVQEKDQIVNSVKEGIREKLKD